MKRLLVIIAMLFAMHAHAQEVCNDGVDNDNDGFVDCYDKKCYANTICKDFFIGKDASCDVKPDSFPPFGMKLKYSYLGGTNHVNRLIVGDVDSDGVPEIVSGFRDAIISRDKFGRIITTDVGSSINIFRAPSSGGGPGVFLNLASSINIYKDGFKSTFEDIAMADINKDGCAEFFVLTAVADGVNYQIIAYDCKGTKIWNSPIDFGSLAGYSTAPPGSGGFSVGTYPGTMGLADFDGDGLVELYVRTQIFDAHTGKFMGEYNIDTQNNTGVNNGVNQGWGMTSNMPIAVDINRADPGLELVAGCRIYNVSINRGAMTATVTPFKERPEYATRYERICGNGTSVGDFNQDGYLDILAVGSKDTYNDNTTIFFWDVKNDVLKYYIDITGIASDPKNNPRYKKGWYRGAGRINIADIDGDTLMNAVYVSGAYLYALKETTAGTGLDTLWRRRVVEETSGFTGCTMFDFNADGKSEIVYRDEENVYIYTTTNVAGVVSVTKSIGQTCKSRTSNEYPIVADIDADGHAEICVTCAEGKLDVETMPDTGGNHELFDPAKICVFESDNVPWVAARRVWNQHGYFIVNVNDNLTIPIQQQLSEKVFSGNAPCKLNGKNRPFNSFLNQAPFMNIYGCPQFAAPNLVPIAASLIVNRPTCPDKDFTISFNIENQGNLGISGNIPVSFYNKNPDRPGATKYNTVFVTLNNLSPNNMVTSGSLTVKGSGAPDSLYIVLNDAGNAVPTSPIKLPNTKFIECDYANTLRTYVVPKPVALTAIPLPNTKCGAVSANNGSASAFIPTVAGGQNVVDYNFYWTKNAVAKPVPADFTGPVFSSLVDGTYSVFAIHKAVKCSSDTVKTVVTLVSRTTTPQIQLVQAYSNCKVPNGQLKVVANGGVDPVTNFDYTWYEGNDVINGVKISVNNIADKLGPHTYTVIVTEKATGCQGSASFDMPDIPKPVITATPTNILCSNANNSGVVTASVISGGALSDFDFSWFNGSKAKPTADFSPGPVYSSLIKGFYTVVATNKISQCSSDTITTQVLQTPKPVLTSPIVTSQTSCDANNPNGTASIGVVGGLASDYTFEWFESPVITGIPVKTGASVTGLKAITYTVKVTAIIGGCSNTSTATIPNLVVTPTLVNIVPTPNSSCTTNTGKIQITSLSLDTPSDYDYQWFIGSSVKAVSDFPLNTTNILSGLTAGPYTVVATHRIRKCTAPAKTITIIDSKPAITIAAPVNNPPNNCTSANGSITVTVTTSNTLGYDFFWYKGGVAVGSPLAFDAANGDVNTSTSSKQDSLSTGTYTVQIIDKDTGCKKEVPIFLPYKLGQKLDIVKVDITKCVGPGGSVDIKVKPTTGFTSAYYDVAMYPDITVDPGVAGAPGGVVMTQTGFIAPDTIVYSMVGTFVPKFYTVVAVVKNPFLPAGNLQGCRASGSFEVKRVTTDPDLNGNAVPTVVVSNTFCKSTILGNPGNGSIKISVDDVSGGIPADEDFQWDPPAPSINSPTQPNLKPGDYTVTVTYTKPLNFGCFSKRTFTVLDKPSQLTVNMAAGDLTLTDVVNCNAAGYAPATNGSAVFQRIKVDGVPVLPNFPGYSFAWQKSDLSPITDGNAQNWDLVNIPVGDYFVTATDNVTAKNCDVNTSFSILDKTVSPVVTLTSFVNPTQCFKVNRLGRLTTQGSGPNSINYSYVWTSAPPLLITQIGGASGQIAQNLNGGSYKIEVTNPANLCKANDTYVLPVERANISLSASSVPITFCVPNPNFEDGAVHATVISVQSVTQKITVENDLLLPTYYTYFWSNAPVPDFQGQNVKNLPLGSYTVKAVDKNDATCVSESIKVDIQDMRVSPIVTAIPQAPVTNCDPTIPNGLATASVGGDNVHYTFTWYQGAVVTPSVFTRGYQADSLKANTIYLAQGMDIVTGCTGTDTTMVKFVPSNGKPPAIEVLSDVTSCDPNKPNGSLGASVNDNVVDYTFTWTKVNDASFAPRVMPVIDGLNVGTYKVVALEIATKCPAEATADIGIHQIVPEFGLTLVDASCDKADGSAGLYLTNAESLNVTTIDWQFKPKGALSYASIYRGNVLTDANAGDYLVTVTTDQGCVADKEFELKSQIHPFNGISRNSDGMNEYFHINCIDNFPNNLVRIFNRAGTLVYEATNYNNTETLFDGKSNRGVSIMGTNLPDGTYFYIIDKRDGSKQLAGYLEIVK